MPRWMPTPRHVREIITTDIEDTRINALISAAGTLVRTALRNFISDKELIFEIIKWVSAHKVALADPSVRTIEEKVGDSYVRNPSLDSATKDGKSRNLLSTWWGQEAAALDYTGTLSRLGGPPPKIISISTPPLRS